MQNFPNSPLTLNLLPLLGNIHYSSLQQFVVLFCALLIKQLCPHLLPFQVPVAMLHHLCCIIAAVLGNDKFLSGQLSDLM